MTFFFTINYLEIPVLIVVKDSMILYPIMEYTNKTKIKNEKGFS